MLLPTSASYLVSRNVNLTISYENVCSLYGWNYGLLLIDIPVRQTNCWYVVLHCGIGVILIQAVEILTLGSHIVENEVGCVYKAVLAIADHDTDLHVQAAAAIACASIAIYLYVQFMTKYMFRLHSALSCE